MEQACPHARSPAWAAPSCQRVRHAAAHRSLASPPPPQGYGQTGYGQQNYGQYYGQQGSQQGGLNFGKQ